MPFKNKKNAIILCILGIITFIFFLILTKVSVEMEKRFLFNAESLFRIAAFVMYLCFMICFLIIFIKLAVTNNVLLAFVYVGLFVVSLGFFAANYLSFNRAIMNFSRPTSPERFIRNSDEVKQLSTLAEDFMSKRNIYYVGNRWRESVYGIRFEDGTYIFNSKNIPKDYKFNSFIPTTERSLVEYLNLPDMPNKQVSNSKIIDQNDYELCVRASILIHRIGFDNVKFYPEPNIVRYEIRDHAGLDSPVYFYEYYYSQSEKLPDNFKYKIKLSDNWYFDSEPRF